MNGLRMTLFGAAILGCMGCGNRGGAELASPPAVGASPSDDVGLATVDPTDWVRSALNQPEDSPSWTYAIRPEIRSAKTLKQTTNWLRWALLRYGQVKEPDEILNVLDVQANGCSMKVVLRRTISDSKSITIYAFKLGDIDTKYGSVMAAGSSICFRAPSGAGNGQVQITEKFFNEGKPNGERVSNDSTATIVLRKEDNISQRVGYALVHASELCGAHPQP